MDGRASRGKRCLVPQHATLLFLARIKGPRRPETLIPPLPLPKRGEPGTHAEIKAWAHPAATDVPGKQRPRFRRGPEASFVRKGGGI